MVGGTPGPWEGALWGDLDLDKGGGGGGGAEGPLEGEPWQRRGLWLGAGALYTTATRAALGQA